MALGNNGNWYLFHSRNRGDWYLFHAGDKYDVVAKKTRKLFRFSIKFIIFA